MRHLSDQTLWDDLPHGWLFWLLLGVYRHLPVTMNLMIVWYTLMKLEKQRRWGAVRHWHFPCGFIGKCSFGSMHHTFARCLVMVQKSFGPTFTHVSGAPDAPVSYFKWFGGQPAGKVSFFLRVFLWIDVWWEPLKDGLSLNDWYLIQFLLTVDLRLETYFTIDRWLKTWDLLYYWQWT